MSARTCSRSASVSSLGCVPARRRDHLEGRPVKQSDINDFVVPRVTDMPEMAVHIVPSAEPPTGIGEPGLPPLAPAFANAIARLTGKPCGSCRSR